MVNPPTNIQLAKSHKALRPWTPGFRWSQGFRMFWHIMRHSAKSYWIGAPIWPLILTSGRLGSKDCNNGSWSLSPAGAPSSQKGFLDWIVSHKWWGSDLGALQSRSCMLLWMVARDLFQCGDLGLTHSFLGGGIFQGQHEYYAYMSLQI